MIARALEEARLILEAVASGEYCCLRHGLPYVTPSLLAEQAFCEMKLHLRLSRGEQAEYRRSELRLLLEALLGAKRLLRPGDEERGVILSTPLAAIVEGLPVIGRPGALAVKGGCIRAIYLLRRRSGRLYPSEIVKGNAYALMADELGAACETLRIAYIQADSAEELREAIKGINDQFNPKSLAGPGSSGGIRVLVYNPLEARQQVRYLAAYWLGAREPRPRPGAWCNRCPYRGSCPAFSPTAEGPEL